MTRPDLPAQAANVLRAIGSPSTCTATQVDSLKLLLLPATPLSVKKPTERIAARQKIKKPALAPSKPANSRARKQPAITIHECVEEKSHNALEPQSRLVLATETINVTLKALTIAVKNPQSPKSPRPKRKSLARSLSGTSFSGATTARDYQTPLQPISANKVVQSPSKARDYKRSSSGLFQCHNGSRTQAECARIGLACLRYLHTLEKFKAKFAPLQLETAMSALIAKFLALGFDDLALKELRILKRRTETLASGQNKTNVKSIDNGKRMSREEDGSLPKESFADLLDYTALSLSGPFLALVVTSQMQALKLLVLKSHGPSTEAALEHLRMAISNAPARLIESQIDPKDEKTKVNAAHMLEILAQTLMRLCPNASKSADQNSKAVCFVSAQAALELQSLAFQIRLRWWNLSNHQPNLETEIIRPFARCMCAFQRRCESESSVKYNLARDSCEMIMTALERRGDKNKQDFTPFFKILVELASESHLYEEAIKWIKLGLKDTEAFGGSPSLRCSLLCHLATIRLQERQIHLDDKSTITSLRDASTCLEGDLRGDSLELDDLLVAVANLRKRVFLIVQENASRFNPSEVLCDLSSLGQCAKLLLLSARFLVRYIGNQPSQDTSDSKLLRYNQRKKLATQITPSIIESVVAISKLSVKSDLAAWLIFNAGLQDCLELARILDLNSLNGEGCPKTSTRDCSLHVSVSQTYWFRFLALKSKGTETILLAKCLHASINILEDRPNNEKVAASFSTKLEKYASLCETSKDYLSASKCYKESIRFCIDSGIVKKLADAAGEKPWPVAVAEVRDFQQLGRSLHALPKAALKVKGVCEGTRIFFDLEWLPSDQRGLLLEQQLASIAAVISSQGDHSIEKVNLNALVLSLLSLYDRDNFPVRRLHICVKLLRLLWAHPDIFEDDVVSKVVDDTNEQPLPELDCSDEGLRAYSAHLRSCFEMYLHLRGNDLNSRDLETIIAGWCRLLQQPHGQRALADHVYDIQDWLQQLEFMSSHFRIHGNENQRTALLHLIVSVNEAAFSTEHLDLASKLTDLGIQYVRLGYSVQGDLILQNAQRRVDISDVPQQLMVKVLLAKAEIRLSIGKLEKCRELLARAKEALEKDLRSPQHSLKDRIAFAQSAADLMLLESKLSTEKGSPDEALFFARACVQENQRIWGAIERHTKNRTTKSPIEDVNDGLTEATSKLSISSTLANVTSNPRYAGLETSACWELSPRLFESFLLLSQCFAHNGLLSEAQYYSAQCQSIADALHSPSMDCDCLMLQGQYAICRGNVEEGRTILAKIEQAVSGLPLDHNNIITRTFMAHGFIQIGQIETGRTACIEAMQSLRSLTRKSALDRLIYKPAEEQSLALQLGAMNLEEPSQSSTKKSKTGQKRAPVKARAQPRVVEPPPVDELMAPDIIPLNTTKSELFRVSALAEFSQDALDAATSELDNAIVLPRQQQSLALYGLLNSQINLRRGLQQLVGDPVFSVLPESSVCCPATTESISTTKSLVTKSSKSLPNKASSKTTIPKDKKAVEKHSQYMSVAQQCLSEVVNTALMSSSTSNVHIITKTMGKILLILSALPKADTNDFSSSHLIAYFLEIGRRVAMNRELLSISVERQLSHRQGPDSLPSYQADQDALLLQQGYSFDFSSFQGDYINIIPKTWQVVSMTLSESHDEIWISKIRTGQSPFVLRLPFNRENTSDGDDENFGFHEGKSEMMNIVEMANTSAHSGQDLSKKGAKTEWWDNRARLDTRLKDLLTNMESIWLGGFRGIFSSSFPESQLLARFQQSLQNILDKHLPSRQMPSKTKQINQVVLDSRVLELFVGLGPPGETNDIDEQLMDLLYFVVDILQFNKERNAYDEIDFDAIVVETVDALRHYHQAIGASESDRGTKHTILILDRHLHGFPWESLPCIAGQSVSRLPSLGCLRRRILEMQKDQGETASSEELDGIHVNLGRGAYILNPAGDLKNTQALFEEPLQRLSTWKSFVGREPNEDDMKSCLRDNELFLYFGHGSGKQYMRSRTIKKLEQCAVALLMGCSSGSLTEAGEYESYGTPIDYMHAGCPALLATLWDVTDKDIDRFSQSVLQKWGLFRENTSSETTSPIKKSVKQKGKMPARDKGPMDESKKSTLSLDDAVSRSRDSCFLRYLNGAAPVVYGVPVYLS